MSVNYWQVTTWLECAALRFFCAFLGFLLPSPTFHPIDPNRPVMAK